MELSELCNKPVVHGESIDEGISIGQEETEYRDDPAINQSGINAFNHNPAKAKFYKDNPKRRETEALQLGTALHCAALEPEKFKETYVQEPDFLTPLLDKYKSPKGSKEYKEKRAAFAANHPGKLLIEYDQALQIAGMVESIASKSCIGHLFKEHGWNELSVYWHDRRTRLRCKARIDRLVPEVRSIVDIKTTGKSAAAVVYGKHISSFGYHLQAAHYLDGCEAVGLDMIKHFIHVVVETEPPYACASYALCDFSIEEGRKLRDQALKTIAICERYNHYPCYPDEVKTVSIPNFQKDVGERTIKRSNELLLHCFGEME